MTMTWELSALFVVAFLQNMAFTAVSRSRNSGDPLYHRWIAMASNGIWFVTYLLIFSQLWQAWTQGEWWRLMLLGVVYVVATTEGSVLMMKIMLRTEKGKRQVGAR